MQLRLIDLSFPIYDRMPTYPVMPKTAITPHRSAESLPFNLHQLVLCTHLGTHLDAPYHFLDDGLTVDKLDLRKCVGPAVVVDLTGKGPKEEIRPEDLYPYEQAIASCRRIILRTGWDKRFRFGRILHRPPGRDQRGLRVDDRAADSVPGARYAEHPPL